MSTAAAFGMATTRSTAARIGRFASDAVETASPAQLLVRLYDRLLLDIDRGSAEQVAGRHGAASTHLVHAQAIVSELMSSLDVDAWSGAPRLLSLYAFLFTELVDANVGHDPARTAGCRALVAPLADAWRQAAVAAPHGVDVGEDTTVDATSVTAPAVRTSLLG